MKNFIKKLLLYILTVATVVGCAWIIADNKIEKSYDSGYDAGYDYGYERGEDIGYSNGYYSGQTDEREKHADMINFVNNYVVFCTDQGEKYHKFDCYHFQNNRDRYYVFNVEYAEYLGYEPCSHCFG